jgi:feruloyl-CoA synthase
MTAVGSLGEAPVDHAGVPAIPSGSSAWRSAGLFAEPDIDVEHRADGTWLLRSRAELGPCERSLGAMLERWAHATPDSDFLCERTSPAPASGSGPHGWRRVTYGEAWRSARAIGQALLDRGLGPDRPVMVLSGNAVDQGLLMLGCHLAGVPIVPVSPAYSLVCKDFAKVRHEVDRTRPGMIYVSALAPFADVLASVDFGCDEVVSSAPGRFAAVTAFADLLATRPAAELDRAFAAVGPETVAKILFTSGSTAHPKGVINTHGMLTANQQMLAQIWPFTRVEPVVLVDWLPWSHTFGGNHNFYLVLWSGGTLYVDQGRPAPGLIETTVANLGDVSPTAYFNVPAGFAGLLPFLEGDEDLSRRFFARLRLILYAAAALPPAVWDRLDALARRITGGRVPMTASWGSTETGPLATSAHFPLERPGSIGVPVPGVSLKLAPSGRTLELLVKGPNVSPGYLGEPELTAAAFDGEGFYRIGDAGRFDDPGDPAKGIVFDGRLAEDFKLSSGTWVSVTHVRTGIVSAAAGLLQDAVITGHDGDEIGVLAWVAAPVAERLLGRPLGGADSAYESALREAVRTAVEKYNSANTQPSATVRRLLVLHEPPSVDHDEITDKGYVNQRAVLERRADAVLRLHSATPAEDVAIFPE